MSDNPSAFPHVLQGQFPTVNEGMTLRDYFAAKALVSLNISTLEGWTVKGIAVHIYEVADAMLAARTGDA